MRSLEETQTVVIWARLQWQSNSAPALDLTSGIPPPLLSQQCKLELRRYSVDSGFHHPCKGQVQRQKCVLREIQQTLVTRLPVEYFYGKQNGFKIGHNQATLQYFYLHHCIFASINS